MHTPSISVIIPTHNRANLLARAIQSAQAQDYPNFDIWLIDDGSTDGTEQLLRQKFPEVHYIKQTQHGVSHARNCGIQNSQGEWLALLDSDDSWQPNKLQLQINALNKQADLLLCHTDEIWIRDQRRVNPMHKHQKYGGFIFEKCLERCLISPSSVLLHRSLFDSVGYFDETLPACEDYDLWLRITARYPVLYLDNKLITKYGGHADQLSKKYAAMDRFRIQSLINLLEKTPLNAADSTAAIQVLCAKLRIYINGAKKRGKTAEVEYYEPLLQYHQRQCADLVCPTV